MTRPLPLALYVMTLPLEECVRTKLRLYHTLCPILPSTIFFLYSKNPHISHLHHCIPLYITPYIPRNVIFVSLLRIVWSSPSPSVSLSVCLSVCSSPSPYSAPVLQERVGDHLSKVIAALALPFLVFPSSLPKLSLPFRPAKRPVYPYM